MTASSGPIAINLPVQLVPQPTCTSCWVAAMAMVVGYRDRSSYSPDTIASQAGMNTTDPYGWPSIQHAVGAWRLRQLGPASALPSDWASLLQTNGPLWIVEIGNPFHAVVVGGMNGDGTVNGTQVTIYNPWPPLVGAIQYVTFQAFDQDFGLGSGAGAQVVSA